MSKRVRDDFRRTCLLCEKDYYAEWVLQPNKFCPECDTEAYNREYRRVHANLSRATMHNLPATLTVKQWICILDYFEWKCAYCWCTSKKYKPFKSAPPREFQVLEHIVSLTQNGGTTADNCVPACIRHNSGKDGYWTSQFDYYADEIEQVKYHLAKVSLP